ncbi:hypothetical protein [Flaviaesturariibacter amylovorans]|uniref:Peptidase MA-like domain-containing protein n=1 Tax=Flaviaesturariibacter amylovorans TaxID=1084520 RepID=A0ABP8HI58_9BACT
MKPLFLCLLLLTSLSSLHARRDAPDSSIVQQLRASGKKIEGTRAIVWYHPNEAKEPVVAAFLRELERGIEAIESFTGRRFDSAGYGQARIEYFVSRATTVSHVYNGYQHNEGPRLPYIFFSAKRLADGTVPYLHETTHLVLRDFHSLWLREGTAEWVAQQVAAQLGAGHTAFYGSAGNEDAHTLAAALHNDPDRDAVLSLVPRNGIPSFTSTEQRRKFYIAGTSFVSFLAELLGKNGLLKLYDAPDTDGALATTLNQSPAALQGQWLSAIRK